MLLVDLRFLIWGMKIVVFRGRVSRKKIQENEKILTQKLTLDRSLNLLHLDNCSQIVCRKKRKEKFS